MDMWITYRLLDDTGEHQSGSEQRNQFTFPDTGDGFELNGKHYSYGPSIGQMLTAIRDHHGGTDAVIINTERA
ncbi:hypothetical protein IMZ11_33625 [Microtetraspora sp. AC03309]|uniref:hypothetical protein n=1 Tax=Microtetraspora sp. AC03309 TaxID=2779376 RepID=UPI001E48F04F|nr:hypothetical protein [Microtetraspora sp. AC03309]MCC5580569.1 hypothetical protein [Microtetraspora sp. AC03309]